jgi:hypothetical protein
MEQCMPGGTMIDRNGLKIASELVEFVEARALPGTGIEPDAFWTGVSAIFAQLAPVNAALLTKRDLPAVPQIDRLSGRRAGAVRGDHAQCRCRGRDDGGAAIGRAGAQRALRAQRRQCALGQPV